VVQLVTGTPKGDRMAEHTDSGHSAVDEYRPVSATWLAEWLQAFEAHYQEHTRCLRRIAGVATLILWLVIASIILFVISFALHY
jgi:hypothetical protein